MTRISDLMRKIQKSHLFMECIPPGRSLGLPFPGRYREAVTLRLMPLRIRYADGMAELYLPDAMAEFTIPSLSLLAFRRLEISAPPARVSSDRVAGANAVIALYEGWDKVLGGERADLQGLLTAALEELGLTEFYAPALEVSGWRQ